MKERKKYMEPDHLPDETEKLIANTKISWSRSKEEVWMEMEKKMDTIPAARTISIIRPWLRVAAAAVITLLIGTSVFIGFYSKTIYVPAGKHSEVYLPDKSLVSLNAQSKISYKPFLWRFSRAVKFEGEAYFEVTKGKQFEVISGKGKTIVIGTSFNIYSRENEYKVTCITGKVKVIELIDNHEVILIHDQQATLDAQGALAIQSDIDTGQTLSWLNNKLSFTSEPLEKVFEEIGRQYGIMIEIPKNLDKTYTGTFMKDSTIENVLNLVCRPFDLNFSRKSDNEYIISRNN